MPAPISKTMELLDDAPEHVELLRAEITRLEKNAGTSAKELAKYHEIYRRANLLLVKLCADGEICALDSRVEDLSAALCEIDGGVFNQNIGGKL